MGRPSDNGFGTTTKGAGMPRHLLKMNEICIVDGITRNTAGIGPVFDVVLAHHPVLFVGIGRKPREMEDALRLLVDPADRPAQARMWGFRRSGGKLDLSGEAIFFVTRCSWSCAGAAMRTFWREWPGRQVAVVTPRPCGRAFQIPESCRDRGHEGSVGAAASPPETDAADEEHPWMVDPAPFSRAIHEIFEELRSGRGRTAGAG